MKRITLILFSVVFLSGCETLKTLLDQPLFQDFEMVKTDTTNKYKDNYIDIGVAGIGTTSAKRRLLIAFINYNNPDDVKVGVCAEPLPDVAENRISSFEGVIKEANINSSSDIKSILLSDRHPATEFYKAGLFSICQMAMSGYIKDEEVIKELSKNLADNAKEIFIKLENKGVSVN